jgi:hypothetical protein
MCIMCGKVRFRKYLLRAMNLDCKNIWVCSHPVSYNHNYLKIGNSSYLYSPCHLRFLKMQYDKLNIQIVNYQFSKILFPLYKRIQELENVAPELTFLLQL